MTYTVQKIAERYAVGEHTVLRWIRTGDLRAIDVSRNSGGKPRWRVTQESLQAFEALRTGTPAPATKRRRRQAQDVIAFY